MSPPLPQPDWAHGARFTPGLTGILRIMARLARLLATLCVTFPLHIAWRALHRRGFLRRASPMPALFLRLATGILGIRIQRSGTPAIAKCLHVANHVSWLDIPVLGGATGCAFLAKAEVARVPGVGGLARLNRTVFVQRESRKAVSGQVEALRATRADVPSVAIFPEGTTTDGQSLLPFNSAMFSVLQPPPEGMLVQPVVIDYGPLAEGIGWVGDETGLNNAARILARPAPLPVWLHFLPPFPPADHHGRKAIAAECHRRIAGELVRRRGAALRRFRHDVPAVGYVARHSDDPPEDPA